MSEIDVAVVDSLKVLDPPTDRLEKRTFVSTDTVYNSVVSD